MTRGFTFDERRVVEAVLAHRARLEVLGDDVGAGGELARDLGARIAAQIDRDALLVAIEHREEAGAGAEQPARAVAVDRLDLDHFGAQVGEHHPARRAHHHVRELDDAQAGERLRGHVPSRSVHRRFHGQRPS